MSLAGGEHESAVVDQLRGVFRAPELLARTFRAATYRHASEMERLHDEKSRLENRVRILREMAERALEVGTGDGNAVIGQVNHDLATAEEQLSALTRSMDAFERGAITEREVIDALETLDPVWDELFPAEQERIVKLLVERVEVAPDGLEVRIRGNGLRTLAAELTRQVKELAA